MTAGWSRKTTKFLSMPVGISILSDSCPGLNSLDRDFLREPPQHDARDVNHEEDESMLAGFTQPLKVIDKTSCLNVV